MTYRTLILFGVLALVAFAAVIGIAEWTTGAWR